MVKIYLGIGSNIEPEKNIPDGLNSLFELFSNLVISPIYLAPPFGFVGDDFHNLVVCAETDLSMIQVMNLLRRVEFDHGRPTNAVKFDSRSLDIDLLLYGNYVGRVDGYPIPRSDITKYDFVLRPLQDIAPDEVHPEHSKSYAELWHEMSSNTHSSLQRIT